MRSNQFVLRRIGRCREKAASLSTGAFDLLEGSLGGACEEMRIHTWNLVYLVGLIVYIAIRGVFGGRTKGNQKLVSRASVSDRALVGAVFIGNIVLPALYLFTSWLGFADYVRCEMPATAGKLGCEMGWLAILPWCGAVLMVIGLWLFWRAHVDLGLNWSITLEMRKDHELIERGVYRRVRHPMYAAIFLFAIAQGLLLQNWLAGWGGFVSFAVLYLVRTPREEKMMGEFFGESYRDYMKRTGRLWPRRRR
jgi:protein-S-isoprenylcysteine O-methyltransferase Ste14